MKSLPGRGEWIVFVSMAIIAGLVVAVSRQRDTMLFVMTLPVFIVGALMGFRRSLAVQPVTAPEQKPQIDGD